MHVACWSVCVCVRTYTVYMHISVTLRVCYICQNFSMCVYIHSVYARIWESLFMSELTPNFSEDVRTGLSQLLFYPFCWPCYLLSCPGSGSLASGSKQSGFVITREIEEAGTTEKVVFS